MQRRENLPRPIRRLAQVGDKLRQLGRHQPRQMYLLALRCFAHCHSILTPALTHLQPRRITNPRLFIANRFIIKAMKIKVVVHEAEEGGYWAEVPAIPGCATQGETFEELLQNLYEAVEGCLSVDVSPMQVSGDDRVLEIAV